MNSWELGHSFNKHLLKAYYEPGTVLEVGNTEKQSMSLFMEFICILRGQ
jgi:hypothetical protein